MSIFKKLQRLIELPTSAESSSTIFWSGAFYGLSLLGFMVMGLSGIFFRTGLPWILMGMTALGVGILGFWLFRIVGALLHRGLTKIPVFVFALVFATVGMILLARFIRFGLPAPVFYVGSAVALVAFAFLFGSGFVLLRGFGSKLFHGLIVILSLTVIGAGLYFLWDEGTDHFPHDEASMAAMDNPVRLLSADGKKNPAEKGIYPVLYFTYGSGTDQRREEFGLGVKYKSSSVDASRMLPDWKGRKAKWRKLYWGFGVEEFPLNARVWMPDGEGPFPLILIVHGNHGMEEYSDPGYAYLGELLASRGFITLSIDENFINGTWSGDFMGKEMPARAWLLLKHLEQWRQWTEDSGHGLHGKADLERVILAGHSRGGEAAPIAASFNKLSFFPDDAREKFNFGFGIKGIVAIAPTDKRYMRRINLNDINYLSLQGSYDSDESSFFGFRQYQRIKFTDTSFHFKSGLYIHRANHGQFNSVWGKYDGGIPGRWLLITKPLITQEEQQQITKVYLAAFAETVLHQSKDFLPLFVNAAVASDWLPTTFLLNTYTDSYTSALLTFDEDIDLTIGTTKGSVIQSDALKVWREETLQFRDKDTQAINAVILGWRKSDDSATLTPRYKVTFEKPLAVSEGYTLLFSMGRGNPDELKDKNEEVVSDKFDEKAELNFRIQITDSLGNQVSTELKKWKRIAPRLKVQYVKLTGINQQNYGNVWEPALETVEVPLKQLVDKGQSLQSIKHIELIFNDTPSGVLILNEIALQKPF